MADPIRVLTDLLEPAFTAVAGEPADPVVRRSDRADYQADGALALAKRLGRAPRDVAADVLATAAPDARGHRRAERDRRAGVRQPRGHGGLPRLAAAGDGRRRPARRGARRPARGGGRRLLRAQRGQGDARRPPPLDDHRRRHRPRAGVPRPRRHPPEPPGRLGHPLRHAPRAPRRHRRRGQPRASSPSPTSRPSTGRPGPSSTPTRPSPSAAASGSCCCSPATQDTLRLWHTFMDATQRAIARLYSKLDVLLTPDDNAGESTYNDDLDDVVAELERARACWRRATARCASSRPGSPTARASRCPSSSARATAVPATPPPTWPPSAIGCAT